VKQHSVAFANFICKFGDTGNLLDYAEEIVIPAFLDDKLIRTYGSTSYFFLKSELLDFGTTAEPRAALCGQFVKDTVLTRSQIFDAAQGLRPDKTSMESALSATFILLLDVHRLIYFAETKDAPDFHVFGVTAASFIKRKRRERIDVLFEEGRESPQTVTKRALETQIPTPTLTVVPLPSDESLEGFLDRYAKLKDLEFRLIRPNDEIDGGAMWRSVRASSEDIRSNRTTLSYHNPDGLDKSNTRTQISEAAKEGNQIVNLKGIDKEGFGLSGNNEHFKLTVTLDDIPTYRPDLKRKLVAQFDHLREAGSISIGDPPADRKPLMRRLIERYLP
jgi:hypothetical protein